jgi:hypothetical protein
MSADGIRHGLDRLERALGEYRTYNRRSLGTILEAKGRSLQWELYRQFRRIAPTPAEITQEAKALGYAIRRRYGPDGKRLSLKQELAARRKSVRWLSVSFLLRAWKRQREGQRGSYAARSRTGAVVGETEVRTARGIRSPRVHIQSYLTGAKVQAKERRLVERAIDEQIADIRRYTARKQQEALRRNLEHLVR